MSKFKVAMLATDTPETDIIKQQLEGIDCELDVFICESDGETIEAIKGADLIINRSVEISREVMEAIDHGSKYRRILYRRSI